VADNAEYDRLFAQLRATPNFSLVSVRAELCNGDRCKIFDRQSGQPVFKDMGHFNPAWMAANPQRFATQLGASTQGKTISASR
jgi:predicted amino acid dehydrogenase